MYSSPCNITYLMRHRIRPSLRYRYCVPLLVCLLPGLIVELFSFWLASFFWKIPQTSNPADSVAILIVSDPQLIGQINEPEWFGFLSRWDADRYLRRGYMEAKRAINSDLEVFLGDLFDEGVFLGEEQQFANARDRFLDIFPIDEHSTNRIYLPGDNDIGGEMEQISPHLYELFKRNFPPHFRSNDSDKFKQLINVYETDSLKFGDSISRICYDGPPAGEHSGGNAVRLLLSHFPVLPHATARMEQQLRQINVVLSAHDHTSGIYMQWRHPPRRAGARLAAAVLPEISGFRWTVSMLEPHTLPLIEFKSPTVSYRMGVPKMGYGLLVVTPFTNGTASVHFSVLWLPSRFIQLSLFLWLTVLGFLWTVLSMCGCCRRCNVVVNHLLEKRRRW